MIDTEKDDVWWFMEFKKLEFTNSLLIGNEKIDDQHKTLVKFYNDFIDIINDHGYNSEHTKRELHRVLDRLMVYTKYHFDLEEKFMQSFEFSNFEKHKQEHYNLIEKLADHCVDTCTGTIGAEDLARFFETWIIVHIKENDLNFIKEYKSKNK